MYYISCSTYTKTASDVTGLSLKSLSIFPHTSENLLKSRFENVFLVKKDFTFSCWLGFEQDLQPFKDRTKAICGMNSLLQVTWYLCSKWKSTLNRTVIACQYNIQLTRKGPCADLRGSLFSRSLPGHLLTSKLIPRHYNPQNCYYPIFYGNYWFDEGNHKIQKTNLAIFVERHYKISEAFHLALGDSKYFGGVSCVYNVIWNVWNILLTDAAAAADSFKWQ